MNEATIALTVMTFLIFVIFLAFFIWGLRSGQFRDIEEAKFIPFREDGSSLKGNEVPAGGDPGTAGERDGGRDR